MIHFQRRADTVLARFEDDDSAMSPLVDLRFLLVEAQAVDCGTSREREEREPGGEETISTEGEWMRCLNIMVVEKEKLNNALIQIARHEARGRTYLVDSSRSAF